MPYEAHHDDEQSDWAIVDCFENLYKGVVSGSNQPELYQNIVTNSKTHEYYSYCYEHWKWTSELSVGLWIQRSEQHAHIQKYFDENYDLKQINKWQAKRSDNVNSPPGTAIYKMVIGFSLATIIAFNY